MDPIEVNFQRYKDKLRKCATNLERVNCLSYEIGKDFPAPTNTINKSDEKAIKLREIGNVHYKKQKYFQALECYTESAAWAQSQLVAAFAYSNRSAVLARIGLYTECVADIQRALKNGYPEESKAKLITRKREAQKLQKVDPSVPNKAPNDGFFFSKCIKVQTDKKYGRHIVAKENIAIGKLLVEELPIATMLIQDFFIYCHECNSLCYNLTPCDTCSKALYCSEECKLKAWQNYHMYECYILDSVDTLEYMKSSLIVAFKLTLIIMRQIRQNNKSELLNELQSFVTHTEKRCSRMLFAISMFSSIICNLLKLKSRLFLDYKNMEDTFKEVFPSIVQIVQINGVLINRLEPDLEERYCLENYASGFYLSYSVFNHSCYPNAFFYHDGTTLKVRALGTIKKGEQIFISYRYTYSTCPKVTRQAHLREHFYFTCSCRACKEDWPEEEETDDFDQPFALVELAHQKNDQDLLKRIRPTFEKRLKKLEPYAPNKNLTCLRQLVVDCYQTYQNPRTYKL